MKYRVLEPFGKFKIGDTFTSQSKEMAYLVKSSNGSYKPVVIELATSEKVEVVSEVDEEYLLNLLAKFVWHNDDCWYDHHANCQAHNLHTYPCPHQIAKTILENQERYYQ